jgi:hypothetical protein
MDWGFPATLIRDLKRGLCTIHVAMGQQEPFPSNGQLSSGLCTGHHLAKVSPEYLLNPQNQEREREIKGEKNGAKEDEART